MTGTHPRAGADTARKSAIELVETFLDPGSRRSWDQPVEITTTDPDYRADLERARERTGLDESVITGEGRIEGRRVAYVACEFRFLAGSIGVAAGERLVRAVERATAERLPLLAAPASGGTRMQEGTVAFLQMVKVAAAITDHKAAGLPYLVHVRHPTTGGVLASWGSLGHVTAAEPGALIGFMGPRVHEALYGEEFPAGVQVAENLMNHGLIDAVLPTSRLAEVAARVLRVLCGDQDAPAGVGFRSGAEAGAAEPAEPAASAASAASGESFEPVEPGDAAGRGGAGATAVGPSAEESIRASRREDRPGVRDLLRVAAEDVSPLSGTGAGEHDPGLLLALARVGGVPCVVLGHNRRGRRGSERASAEGQPLGPAGLRTARRGMRIAAELGLPLLTVIDTAGAALSREAEEGGLAGEIARCLADMVTLPAPTLCLLLGQGAGGAALALLPADRVVAARHAWLSPLPPEGASAILHRTTERAYEVADRQGVRSADLLVDGIVDRVVEEGEEGEGEGFLGRLGRILGAELAALRAQDPEERLAARRARHRRIGVPS
ncbi:carboxyl transferase domain-containing protein [Streptomyces sp. NEAU-S77]|uniref:carboxyl transferase domain-containing protein n=1 Tax=Streptomyces sp. NEAU-S77 TaxID=3411033 RepID=UPI003B9E49D7